MTPPQTVVNIDTSGNSLSKNSSKYFFALLSLENFPEIPIPIFAKSFNPNSSTLDADTGTFDIDNHFFRTGEELIYTPKSTIIGIGSTPVMYRDTSAGITSTLPSTVFGIKKTDNSFQIATTRANANAGTAITFTGFGEGNAHTLSMKDPNERSLITIDDITQYKNKNTHNEHIYFFRCLFLFFCMCFMQNVELSSESIPNNPENGINIGFKRNILMAKEQKINND